MTAKQASGTYAPDGSLYITLTDGAGTLASAGSTTTTIGTSTITSGTNKRVLFDDNGVIGEDSGIVFDKATGALTVTKLGIGAAPGGATSYIHTETNGNVYWSGHIAFPSGPSLQCINDALNAYVPFEFRGSDLLFVAANGVTFSTPWTKTIVATVATLTSAATAGVGARSFVTDATVSVFASTVIGGGSVSVPVYSDGTNWKIG